MKLTRYFKPDPWIAGILLLCALVFIPLAIVAGSLVTPTGDVWHHLVDTLLWTLIKNSALLLAFVGAGTLLLGVGLAWLAAVFEFPGRGVLEWVVILPFAFPTYVLGFVFLDLFGIAGPVQGLLKRFLGSVPGWYPDMRSAGGVALVMVLAFFPYVYLLTRAAFRTHGKRILEVAGSLGHGPAAAFFRVVLPMARPWIFGGLLLVAMETLADFGTVSIFNFDTFTTAIYKAWYSLFSLDAAAQLASLLLFIALLFLVSEKYYESRRRFYQLGSEAPSSTRIRLKGARAWTASACFMLVFAVSFLLPLAYLFFWSWRTLHQEMTVQYGRLVQNTLLIGLAAAVLVSAAALFLVYGARLKKRAWLKWLSSGATLGYALPGTVLAVGVFIPIAWLDNRLAEFSTWAFGIEPVVLLNGTLFTMLMAYFIRFQAVAFQPLQSAMQRIRPSMDESAKSLGRSNLAILWRIHLPLMRGGLITALLLVTIDVMKEMPITLMTRPFGWDTLSIRIFELTSEGEYKRAALPSALLVLTGLVPVSLLIKLSEKSMEHPT